MQHICAWCHTPLLPTEMEHDNAISHGICDSCSSNIFFQMGVSLQEFIDDLDKPVCVVDHEGIIVTANHKTQEMLSKPLEEIRNRLGGDVFECAYSRLPEGCGKTIHCSGCTIRKSVNTTFHTGVSIQSVPAVLNQGELENISPQTFAISTQKVGNAVFLTIEA